MESLHMKKFKRGLQTFFETLRSEVENFESIIFRYTELETKELIITKTTKTFVYKILTFACTVI